MSNREPEIQCSLKPWMLDISYVYHVENFVRNHQTYTLYERYPNSAIFMSTIAFNRGTGRQIDPNKVVLQVLQNHLDYIRDVLSTTAYLIDERRRRNWRWTMLSIYSRMTREKRK
jgi:hypothetical protein